jgi:hypothetical protein
MGQWTRVTEEEKREMLAELAAGTEALLKALDGLTDDEARRSPSPDCWSVLACVEHVALVEEYLLGRLREAVDSERMPNPEREARIRRWGANRSRRVPAPEMVVPAGRFATIEDAVRAYRSSREETIRYTQESRGDLRAAITTHPVFGKVNCYEMLLMMAIHPRRHASQIEDVRQATGSAPSPPC